MNKQFTLYTQLPKAKRIGGGVLSVGKDGDAMFFSGDGERDSKNLAEMIRVKLDFAGSNGLRLSGFERNGVDSGGREKYRFQEWWLAYNVEPEAKP